MRVFRVECGRDYLAGVASPPWQDWHEGFAEFRAGRLSVTRAVLLAHPMWLRTPNRRERIYGSRRFGRSGISSLQACSAITVWDYACDLDEPIEFDHRFPYSFGGPTVAENRLSLCRVHNATKGSDVHLFDWSDDVPPWLDPLLQRLQPWT